VKEWLALLALICADEQLTLRPLNKLSLHQNIVLFFLLFGVAILKREMPHLCFGIKGVFRTNKTIGLYRQFELFLSLS